MNDSAACRRRHILAAAERLLGHYGPGKTTVADIAKAADVGVGTIYLEFPSKDAILIALSEERYSAIFEAMENAATGEGSHAQRLRRIFERRLDGFIRLIEAGAHASDLVHCGACPAIHGVRLAFEERQQALLEALLSEAEEAEIFACGDPAATGAVLLQAFATFAPPLLYGRSLDGVRDELRALVDLMIHGLARR